MKKHCFQKEYFRQREVAHTRPGGRTQQFRAVAQRSQAARPETNGLSTGDEIEKVIMGSFKEG